LLYAILRNNLTCSRRSPDRDENLRVKDRSRSRSQDEDKVQDLHDRDVHDEGDRARYEGQDNHGENYDDRHREDRDFHGNRTRSASVDSRHRSRHSKDKHRSSRSHRDRSREHRRRHRSRSRSSFAEEKYEDEDSSSRRKSRSERDKYRERDRSRDRDRDRDRRDRKDRDYDDEKYRREKDKEKRRRREREDEDDRDYDEDRHHSSRRSRKERDRERDREYNREPALVSSRAASPPLNAPTGPSADNFSIRGASKPKAFTNMPPPQPPTGPRGFQPPKGPSADRDRHNRKGSMSSIASTPTTPVAEDHYAAEREKNARERDRLDRGGKNFHTRTVSRPTLPYKRSHDDYEFSKEDANDAPTAPASHRDKRRRSGTGDKGGGDNLTNRLAKGLRKANSGSRRRGGVKNEDDVDRELERVERERDGRRR
jgi:hypothetical protein